MRVTVAATARVSACGAEPGLTAAVGHRTLGARLGGPVVPPCAASRASGQVLGLSWGPLPPRVPLKPEWWCSIGWPDGKRELLRRFPGWPWRARRNRREGCSSGHARIACLARLTATGQGANRRAMVRSRLGLASPECIRIGWPAGCPRLDAGRDAFEVAPKVVREGGLGTGHLSR